LTSPFPPRPNIRIANGNYFFQRRLKMTYTRTAIGEIMPQAQSYVELLSIYPAPHLIGVAQWRRTQ